jgi:erythromycin esterase
MACLRCGILCSVLTLVGANAAVARQSTPSPAAGGDSGVVQWARTHAIRLPSVDAPYDDGSFAFLRPLVGKARILAIGELIHGGHQPLAFRNEVIRYAVTHLGVTAVAIESGLTEANIVDRFIQDGAGNIDSVVRTGFTWEFETLPENRDLVVWLRAHNTQATRKVHFYGLDLSGTNDVGFMPGARGAVLAALDYLAQVAPAKGAALRTDLLPLMDRFVPARYTEYSASDRDLLKTDLSSAYQTLLVDSIRTMRATSPLAYARGLRNAWMAIRINEIMSLDAAGPPGTQRASSLFRDSTMAENVRWVLGQQAPGGRVVVFAHNGHVMNTEPVYDGQHLIPLGRYLRSRFDSSLVVLASATGTIVGGTGGVGGWLGDSGEAHAEPTTFAAMLAQVGLPTFVLDVRAGDHIPDIAAAFTSAWPFLLGDQIQSIVPRQAFDAIVYLDRVTPSKVH